MNKLSKIILASGLALCAAGSTPNANASDSYLLKQKTEIQEKKESKPIDNAINLGSIALPIIFSSIISQYNFKKLNYSEKQGKLSKYLSQTG